jgi:heme oxygenase
MCHVNITPIRTIPPAAVRHRPQNPRMSDATPPPLAERLRLATTPLHRRVESSPFVQALLHGRLARRGYALMLRSLFDIYAALEAGLARHAQHAAIATTFDPALFRREALGRDLAVLHGPAWMHELEPVPTTSVFVQRLHRLAADRPDALVAHAYTRYLGDLSGGQILRRAVARSMALPAEAGLAFYAFDAVPPVAARVQAFRAGLDRIPGAYHDAIAAEALEAFGLHERLFAELAAASTGPQPSAV